MQLILTHENADFDAIASQLAASKLYPEATPLLPRRVNRNVQQFLTLYWDVLPFTRPGDWKRRVVHPVEKRQPAAGQFPVTRVAGQRS